MHVVMTLPASGAAQWHPPPSLLVCAPCFPAVVVMPAQEPKLDMARRVISGKYFSQSWVELDSEIAAFEASIALSALEGSSSHVSHGGPPR
jgi:hypothetical protein